MGGGHRGDTEGKSRARSRPLCVWEAQVLGPCSCLQGEHIRIRGQNFWENMNSLRRVDLLDPS